MVDQQIKLGTSTPKADPSGDYAWEVFAKADKLRPGAGDILSNKALQLTKNPGGPAVPEGRSLYAQFIAQGEADIFLTYCTNALAAQTENPALRIIQLPETLAVGADYGLTVMNGASSSAQRLASCILAEDGQQILKKYGFAVSVK